MLNFSFLQSDFVKKFKQRNTWNKNHIDFYAKLGNSMNRLLVFVEKIGKYGKCSRLRKVLRLIVEMIGPNRELKFKTCYSFTPCVGHFTCKRPTIWKCLIRMTSSWNFADKDLWKIFGFLPSQGIKSTTSSTSDKHLNH